MVKETSFEWQIVTCDLIDLSFKRSFTTSDADQDLQLSIERASDNFKAFGFQTNHSKGDWTSEVSFALGEPRSIGRLMSQNLIDQYDFIQE